MSGDFFAPPPRRLEEPRPRPPSPPWAGPPYGVLPGVVAVELVIASGASAVVYVGRCSAYPTGFELEVRVMLAADATDLDPSLNGPYHRPGGSNYDEMLKFGVEFSDGRKATNVGGRGTGFDEPEEPVLWGMGGGGGGGCWRQDFWVWPLPPAGPVALVCEWPEAGIPLSRAEMDPEPLLAAAGRAVTAFPDEPGPSAG